MPLLLFVFRYHQYSTLKRVRSYGDGIYCNDQTEPVSNDTQEVEHILSSDRLENAAHSNCLSCQKQFNEEYDRKAYIPSRSTALNYEAVEPSLSMLIWDQNHARPMCPTYDQIPMNNRSKMETRNGNLKQQQ